MKTVIQRSVIKHEKHKGHNRKAMKQATDRWGSEITGNTLQSNLEKHSYLLQVITGINHRRNSSGLVFGKGLDPFSVSKHGDIFMWAALKWRFC